MTALRILRQHALYSTFILLATASLCPVSCLSAGRNQALQSKYANRHASVTASPRGPRDNRRLFHSSVPYDFVGENDPGQHQYRLGYYSTHEVDLPRQYKTATSNAQKLTRPKMTLIATTSSDSQKDNIPSVRKVFSFAIPAIGVWLCMPLLSIMDTSVVGRVAGTAQQAALNPAIAVLTYSSKLFAFLFTGTTTMVSAACEDDRNSAVKTKTASTLMGAMQFSLLVGTGLGALVLIFARSLLFGIMGTESVDAAVLVPAMKYLRIRALALPAAALLGCAQTASLGMQDFVAPLAITVVAVVVNWLFNAALVGMPSAAVGGAAGAAWSTVIAQYAAVGLFWKWITMRSAGAELQQRRRRKSPLKSSSTSTTRGVLSKYSLLDFLRIPNRETSSGFAPFFVPVTTTQVGRTSSSLAVDYVVASSFGTIGMAANQIITSVYYGLVAPIADSLNLAGQSFTPGIAKQSDGPEKAKALSRLRSSLFQAGGICGVVLAAIIVGSMGVGCSLFTSDPVVTQAVRSAAPFLFFTSALQGLFTASEGMLLGQKDLGFLGKMYGAFSIVVPFAFLQLKRLAQSNTSISLTHVWQVWLLYAIVRVLVIGSRVVWIQQRSARAPTLERRVG